MSAKSPTLLRRPNAADHTRRFPRLPRPHLPKVPRLDAEDRAAVAMALVVASTFFLSVLLIALTLGLAIRIFEAVA